MIYFICAYEIFLRNSAYLILPIFLGSILAPILFKNPIFFKTKKLRLQIVSEMAPHWVALSEPCQTP